MKDSSSEILSTVTPTALAESYKAQRLCVQHSLVYRAVEVIYRLEISSSFISFDVQKQP